MHLGALGMAAGSAQALGLAPQRLNLANEASPVLLQEAGLRREGRQGEDISSCKHVQ
jgi:hypothetical protein